MPEICRFHGVVIKMYADDHAPAHFHAEYAGREAAVAIATLALLRSDLPRRIERMVLRWSLVHARELEANWSALVAGRSPRRIAPLE